VQALQNSTLSRSNLPKKDAKVAEKDNERLKRISSQFNTEDFLKVFLNLPGPLERE
jgi:hypothetical protein